MIDQKPIIIIEDDLDDQEFLSDILKKLNYGHPVMFFPDGVAAFDYLNGSDVKPFLILSDVNMPKINGFELKERIQSSEDLAIKCIPFLFFTTAANKETVIDAYSKVVQGFFIKPNNYKELERRIKVIMDYWKDCIAPNNYD